MFLLDCLGAIFSLLATIALAYHLLSGWALSLVAVALNTCLYFKAGIFADAGLEIFYGLTSIYGWLYWSKPQKRNSIYHLHKQQCVWLAAGVMLAIVLLQLFLAYVLHSSVAWLDATTAVLSLVAQILLCRRVRQAWLLWLLADALYVILYTYKGLPYHMSLMLVYCVIATWSFCAWQQRDNQALLLKKFSPK